MPGPDNQVQEPEKILIEFISAMNAWETACSGRRSKWKEQTRATGVQGDYTEIQAINARELEQIFRKYCAPNQPRTQAASWRRPPEYSTQTEKIIEVVAKDGEKCRLRTEYTGDARPKTHE